LEIQLAKLKTLENPSLNLEQYPVSPRVAAELLYMAGFEHDDLQGRTVDLGTGTGRLAIGAALMGSTHVTGVDADSRALALARGNAGMVGVEVEWIQSPVEELGGRYDVVVMNPPYGTRRIHADLQFLRKSFQLAPVTYTIHKSSTRSFLSRYVKKTGGRIDETRSMRLEIPHLFSFHRRRSESIEVDILRIIA
jgi:predicted RNA methylase